MVLDRLHLVQPTSRLWALQFRSDVTRPLDGAHQSPGTTKLGRAPRFDKSLQSLLILLELLERVGTLKKGL
jgi:hypothetical protein